MIHRYVQINTRVCDAWRLRSFANSIFSLRHHISSCTAFNDLIRKSDRMITRLSKFESACVIRINVTLEVVCHFSLACPDTQRYFHESIVISIPALIFWLIIRKRNISQSLADTRAAIITSYRTLDWAIRDDQIHSEFDDFNSEKWDWHFIRSAKRKIQRISFDIDNWKVSNAAFRSQTPNTTSINIYQ